MVQAAEWEYEQQWSQVAATGSALVPDLPFGIWTTLYSRDYYGILNKSLRYAFANRPRQLDRELLYSKLREVRLFRNRVYHDEPLCFQKQSANILCFGHLQAIHHTICELLLWLDSELPVWLTEVDRVPEVLKKMHKKYSSAG